MSQAKVDRYKEQKKNRKQIIKKEKREWAATKAGLSLVALVLVAWIGVSIYGNITAPDTETATAKETYSLNTSAIDDFLNSMDAQ